MASSDTITTPDGITWFYRQEGNGPHVVLIPSGEGDCDPFIKVSEVLSKSFTVTTFDTPGMSRSVPTPPGEVKDVTANILATQVKTLLEKLDIKVATFWGSSSGGATALALAALYPERVRNVIVHEVPTIETAASLGSFLEFKDSPNFGEALVKGMSANMVGDDDAFDALGKDYYKRLVKNQVLWAQEYTTAIPQSVSALLKDEANLKRRPIDWTVGSLTPTGHFFDGFKLAIRLGIPTSLLPSLHFPQITIPQRLAEFIEQTTKKYL